MVNEERSLMQVVLKNPFDDTPRLILADWYQDNDQAVRASFIRAQILEGSSGNCICGARGPFHVCWTCKQFFDVKNVSGTSAAVISRRGFIDEIRCTQSAFLGSLCGRCNGHGIGNDRIEGTAMRLGCGLCNGVGRIGGIAKHVGESWPVTKVFITDAIVHSSFGADYFYLGGLGMFPSRYWKALDNHRSRNDVRNALERVCVSYMRELANLPPLDGFIF